MGSESADVGPVADELYGLPASEFTAARDRHAGAARQAGDRALAAEIKKLRRPTASASLTNQLVRARADEIAKLLGLGAELRAAQTHLAADELRRLSQLGQQVVVALGRVARDLAAEAGQPAGESSIREVEDTLHAALADPGAGEAVRSGRLTTALHYAGFGSVDISGAVAAASSRRQVAPAQDPSPAPTVRQLKAELAEARKISADQERGVQKARRHRERLDEQILKLGEQLEQLRAEERDAAAAVREAERALHAAQRRAEVAKAALDGSGGS